MAITGTTKTTDITVQAREQDFVSVFGDNWQALLDIIGISRPIKKTPGTKLVANVATVELENGAVAEGELIPFSQATVTPVAYSDITVKKYAKNVTIEAVAKYGAKVAVQKTDDAFRRELQNVVLADFYTFLKTGSLTGAENGFQMALAMAKAKVIDKFNTIRKTVTDVVGFVNVLDFYQYLGGQNITVQNQFGMTYVKDYLGYGTIFLLSAPDIPRGKVVATPVDNIDLYYIDPNDSDFKQLGLEYTTDGTTNLIGFHVEGDYSRATGATYALMGMTLWAEYLDGIAVIDIDSNFLNDLTVATETDAFGTLYGGKKASDLQTDVTVANGEISGTLKFIEGGLAETGPLAGDGYFLALKWSNLDTHTNSLKVGLNPSIETGLVECFADADRNGVFKITDNKVQKLEVIQSDGTHRNIQYFGLGNLVLEPKED